MADRFVQTTEIDEILRNLKAHQAKVMVAIGQAVAGAGEVVITKAKAVHVPVLTGNLRSTGQVSVPKISNGVIEVEMSFGGPAAPYAQAVHDAPPDWGQGKRHYLLIPFNEVGRTLDKRIRDHVYPLFR